MNTIPCYVINPESVTIDPAGRVRIEPDITPGVLDSGNTLRDLQVFVGGLVDCFDIALDGIIATLWFHDEGKVIGLQRNALAESVALAGGWRGESYGDWIAGPVVVTGFDPETGDTIGLPETWQRVLAGVAKSLAV